jgi:DNA-binding response OmpR family regulator
MRRTRAQNPPTTKKTVQTFDRGRLVLDLEASTLMVRGAFVNLTTTEFKLMTVLASRPGKIFSRSDLSYQVLGYRFQGDSRSIDTHLKNLRKKIEEDNKAPKYIITMVGSGYKLAAGSDDGEEE